MSICKLYMAVSLFALLLLGCSSFDRSYDQIDPDMVRVIDFSFENPDLAPGDTAVLYAIFAGEEVKKENISWDVSWNVLNTLYGDETVFGEEPLSLLEFMAIDSTPNTQTFKISFVIPPTIIAKSSAIPEAWGDLLREYQIDFNPADFGLPPRKSEMLFLLDTLAKDNSLAATYGISGEVVEAISQIFTVGFKLYANIEGGTRRRLSHSVRYHSKLNSIAGVYTNSKPLIDSVTIRKYSGDISSISKGAAYTTTKPLNDTLTLTYQSGSSYFLVYHISPKDTTALLKTLTQNIGKGGSKVSLEEYEGDLFYNEDNEFLELKKFSAVDGYDAGAALFFKIKEPEKKGPVLTWLKVSDKKFGVSLRPRGSSMKELTILVK